MLEQILSAVAGAMAGALGSLLGLGGGIFLVPFLNVVLGMPYYTAAGVSLITVIGTSLAVSMSTTGRGLVNLRLGMVLQILTALGATSAAEALAAGLVSEAAAKRVFGTTAAIVAVVMLQRLGKRNVIADQNVDVGALGGRLHDPETGAAVSYRVRRLPLALGVSFGAGIVSTLAGVGGGILLVPVLNSWCGVPLRAAAATSVFVIGVTAVPGVVEYFRQGRLTAPELAAAAVIGVMIGSKIGVQIGRRTGVKPLKILLAVLLAVVAVEYLFLHSVS